MSVPSAPEGSIAIDALQPNAYRAAIPGLAALLVDAVRSGASVNFLAGLTEAEAVAWWESRAAQVADGTITAFVARDLGRAARADEAAPGSVDDEATNGSADGAHPIVGSTLMIRSRNPNSPHRAEIAKVLVHSAVRRRGVGRALMDAVEETARAEGRWLLLLDTQAGTAAEAMYRALGWQELGTMSDHSLRTDGVLAPTVFFWKDLRTSRDQR